MNSIIDLFIFEDQVYRLVMCHYPQILEKL